MSTTIEQQFALLNRLAKEQDAIYQSLALHFKFSDTAFRILYALCESDRTYTQHDLCMEWYYPKQTINSAINKLVTLGYITLVAIPNSKNKKQILLTEYGMGECQKHIIPLMKAEIESFSVLTNEERQLFLDLFKKQVHSLKLSTDNLKNTPIEEELT